ncbi:zinc-dependent peptidase [Sediminibacterium sp.]|uniref:zinc-dependent peptidase n=1 Tax=Sediminibacterium sp. TaxID=1917865 RepID=UPI0027338B3A|nr:zinc-dependent peptidase [Sediminibacterium sp.]MDP3567346.1 zinc-dependent peptidase [Sediminibacterium sp.]
MFYTKYFKYYTTLNTQLKEVFNERCLEFISQKTIIGFGDFKPNNKVKAIIAASAVQLTLGLETWNLSYFDTIVIHSNDFDDKKTGLKFKGGTNLSGIIQFSWKDFISGYKIADDNINLGIHEFTHALKLNAIRNNLPDYFFENYFSKWQAAANDAFNDIRNNRETIFRKYGGANLNEFVSVCFEHYFESPEEIKKQYPNLYYATGILLNQQTQNNITNINVREKLLSESNLLNSGFSSLSVKTNPLKSSSFILMLILSIPLIYTLFTTSFNSGASIFLMLLALVIYLRFDFTYTTFCFDGIEFKLKKGLFLFKNWQSFSVAVSNIISARLYDNNDLEVVVYNSKNKSFYEETVSTNQAFSPEFINEIITNKIAFFKS